MDLDFRLGLRLNIGDEVSRSGDIVNGGWLFRLFVFLFMSLLGYSECEFLIVYSSSRRWIRFNFYSHYIFSC